MSKTDAEILKSYISIREKIIKESKLKSSKQNDTDTVAAILVLASELRGTQKELKRIAKMLGADLVESSKLENSDVPNNMLALLSALRASTSGVQ